MSSRFNRISIYALNKKDPDAIVYPPMERLSVLPVRTFQVRMLFLRSRLGLTRTSTRKKTSTIESPITRFQWMIYPRRLSPCLRSMLLWLAARSVWRNAAKKKNSLFR